MERFQEKYELPIIPWKMATKVFKNWASESLSQLDRDLAKAYVYYDQQPDTVDTFQLAAGMLIVATQEGRNLAGTSGYELPIIPWKMATKVFKNWASESLSQLDRDLAKAYVYFDQQPDTVDTFQLAAGMLIVATQEGRNLAGTSGCTMPKRRRIEEEEGGEEHSDGEETEGTREGNEGQTGEEEIVEVTDEQMDKT
ncbi:uncharacterized protein ACNLHF_012093 [Anomaloglossus baeobatrachus]